MSLQCLNIILNRYVFCFGCFLFFSAFSGILESCLRVLSVFITTLSFFQIAGTYLVLTVAALVTETSFYSQNKKNISVHRYCIVQLLHLNHLLEYPLTEIIAYFHGCLILLTNMPRVKLQKLACLLFNEELVKNSSWVWYLYFLAITELN